MNQASVNNPLKWYNEDIINDGVSYIRYLSEKEHDLVLNALSVLEQDSLSSENKGRVNQLLSQGLNPLYEEIMNALLHKRGFITLKGFPSSEDKYDPEIIKDFFISLCLPLGAPLIQNRNQDIIFDVKSIEGMKLNATNSRGPYVKESLPMHTDAGAILGMYCFASADVGGHTILSSSRAVHDEIKKVRPDLLDILYQPFYTDRRGNEPEGSLPYDLNPVFAMYEDQLRCQYHQPFYDDAQTKFPDIPRYTPQQIEALKLFDTISLQKNIAFETKLEPGSLIFINNEEILHGRTTFDFPENHTVRHLLRIWLNTPEIKNTFPSFLGYI
ncbi:hypothetical protein FOLKNPGA_02113 [Legionella sp. PC1000]|uniref:TauD/TfdA family dioxygenase n=1 Tax=Legionella sp. PC1000 TaxID=2746060 RepID=UPI0015FB5695|nr:TauD/TfdA family dioxygenase [Legionella sp. PC1000]QLZ69330.1 hypothetical protein FOLKNPGA_02113 [Legionella sp. PC1000]